MGTYQILSEDDDFSGQLHPSKWANLQSFKTNRLPYADFRDEICEKRLINQD